MAYLWSLFFGFLGADLFYLGFPLWGAMKLATLGGFGFWWLYDIVRVGSAPVYAREFRTSNDIPHWAFVLATVWFFMFMGFFVVGIAVLRHRHRKRKDALIMQAEEEARKIGEIPSHHKHHHEHRHHHHKKQQHHEGHSHAHMFVPQGNPPMRPGGPYLHHM